MARKAAPKKSAKTVRATKPKAPPVGTSAAGTPKKTAPASATPAAQSPKQATGKVVRATARSETKPAAHKITDDMIRERAYHLYELREPNSGTPMDDWLRAEAELRSETRRSA